MTQSFTHFHNAHNSRIDLILSILINSLFRCLLFFRLWNAKSNQLVMIPSEIQPSPNTHSFFHLNLINLYSEQFVRKFVVELKFVLVFDFTPARYFRDDTCLAASQRLQRAFQFTILLNGR